MGLRPTRAAMKNGTADRAVLRTGCAQSHMEAGGAAGRTKRTALGARYRRLRGHVGHGRAVLAIGCNILEIAYHLLSEQTTYSALTTSTVTAMND